MGEAFKWPVGLSRKPKHAKTFYSILSAATALGMGITLTPIDPIKALYWSAVINGVVAVPVMTVMMIITAQRKIMKKFIIVGWLHWLGWASTPAGSVGNWDGCGLACVMTLRHALYALLTLWHESNRELPEVLEAQPLLLPTRYGSSSNLFKRASSSLSFAFNLRMVEEVVSVGARPLKLRVGSRTDSKRSISSQRRSCSFLHQTTKSSLSLMV